MDPRRGVQACVVDVYWRETVCGWCVGVGCGEGCVWGLPVCTECSAMPSSDSTRSAGPDTLRFSVSFTCTLKRIPAHRAVKHINSDVTGIEIDTSEKKVAPIKFTTLTSLLSQGTQPSHTWSTV